MDVSTKQNSSEEELKQRNRDATVKFKALHIIVVIFFSVIFTFHALGIYLFCSGFLLSRLVLPNRSECAISPIASIQSIVSPHVSSSDNGCWHPKTFNKAVIVVIDALRYDFSVPFQPTTSDPAPHLFHNNFPILHDTALQHPENAFLRPFIADPPTTTLQRLKGLMTGTLPTLLDAGSNFAGTAIDEDNLIEQLHRAGKKIVHLGDDTWHALFPGFFEPNLTRAYDSFNVWDLHTLDNGVNQHIFPLLEDPALDGRWDVLIGHYLGVDHAGHRYGPEHVAMKEKLQQMNGIVERIIQSVDEDTLVVVMGDHGMDVKGDHGGESDDEVEATLWMYSKRKIFGRSQEPFKIPPTTAKERPVAQIDLVPTLALLLGLPIPFGNLGHPIEEAFIGSGSWANLATVGKVTAHQIHNYQAAYNKARGVVDSETVSTFHLWNEANASWTQAQNTWLKNEAAERKAYDAYRSYQATNLAVGKSLWARFDLNSMAMGIIVLVGSFILLACYSQGIHGDRVELTPALLRWSVFGMILGGITGAGSGTVLASDSLFQYTAFGAAMGGLVLVAGPLFYERQILRIPYPRTFWGGLCFLVTVMLAGGFAANSFTIWEDEQLLFIITTFGILMLGSSLGQSDPHDRRLGTLHSISFLIATRISSFSRLCREEQAGTCQSTYYASATSSTSAQWQLVIPYAVALILPTTIKDVFQRTRNYQGSAVIWVGIALRLGLCLVAFYWLLDSADDGDWFPNVSKETLKTVRMYMAQIVLALTFAAGYATYIFASPFLKVISQPAPETSVSKPINNDPNAPILTTTSSTGPKPKLIIMGYANTHGTRYFLLSTIWLLALLLVSKPMGQGTLALCLVSILNLLEILSANTLHLSPLGPVLLALLGSYYFFKTGHQASLATIQWESAFVPSRTITYPLSPLMVILNTFAPQILCVLAVPAIPMWKVAPKQPFLLSRVAQSLGTHVLFYAAISLATVVECAWLRRHLMLYRVFMPRMLMGVVVLLLVDVLGAVVALGAVRWSVASVGEVFGWV